MPMKVFDGTECPHCDSKDIVKTANATEHHSDEYKCNVCKFEFGQFEAQDELDERNCTHDDVSLWMTVLVKEGYQRNRYSGELEETFSNTKETYHDSADIECDECGSVKYSDLIWDKPEGWKPEEPVWEIEVEETEIRRKVYRVMGKDITGVLNRLSNGDSELVVNEPIEMKDMQIIKHEQVSP